jgi:hypothetical protein
MRPDRGRPARWTRTRLACAALLVLTACATTPPPVAVKLPDNVTSTDVTIDGVHAKRFTREDAKAEILYFGDSSVERLMTLPVNMLMIAGNVTPSTALAAVDYLKKENALPIIAHGFGADSALAAQVAGTRELPGLVLEATSGGDAIAQMIGDYRGSILFVIGEKDRVAPMSISGKLHDDAGVSPWKRVVVAAGRSHGNAMTADVSLASYRELVNYIAH